jgi:nicotinamide-nucleotide amidase
MEDESIGTQGSSHVEGSAPGGHSRLRFPAAILAIGDEIVSGRVVDTNGPWLSRKLAELGGRVVERRCVADDVAEIVSALHELAGRCRVVVVTGGLGPTPDDKTAEAAAEAVGGEKKLDEASAAKIRERFEELGREATADDVRSAWIPARSRVLSNPAGLAPGFRLRLGDALCVFFPGVPVEMEEMFEYHLDGELAEMRRLASRPLATRLLRVTTLGESSLMDRVGDVIERERLTPHYIPLTAGVDLLLESGTGDEDALERAAAEVGKRLGWRVYATRDEEIAEVVGRSLSGAGRSLATAESCTGGLLGHLITEIAGSSEYFKMGVVTYSNEAKMQLIGVSGETLASHGAVSRETVEEMACGVRALAGSHYGVSISGIAGPSGGTPEKPVGTVHIAVSCDKGVYWKRFRFPGTRSQVKRRSAHAALTMLHRILTEGDETCQS